MNENYFNYILVTEQLGSISKAADKLKISQPALSAHIKKIEADIGVLIFDRSCKPLALTAAGRIYLEHIKKVVSLNRQLSQQIADLGQLKAGMLTIGGASFFNVSYLPQAISAYARRYPGINIEVIDGKMPEIIEKAINHQLDLFVCPPWQKDKRFRYEKILSEQIFICIPPDWEINKTLQTQAIPIDVIMSGRAKEYLKSNPACAIDFKTLEGQAFVLLKKDQHIGDIMSQLFVQSGFEPKQYVAVEQTMTSYALTLAGVGISMITESCIKSSNFQNYPSLYAVDSNLCNRDMYVAYPKRRYLSQASKEFIEILKIFLNGSI